eukprot:9499406-Pyramimonas_sp.AAC.1
MCTVLAATRSCPAMRSGAAISRSRTPPGNLFHGSEARWRDAFPVSLDARPTPSACTGLQKKAGPLTLLFVLRRGHSIRNAPPEGQTLAHSFLPRGDEGGRVLPSIDRETL